jgi:cytochrome c peroxidase
MRRLLLITLAQWGCDTPRTAAGDAAPATPDARPADGPRMDPPLDAAPPVDAAAADAGPPDAGPPDAGSLDAARLDAALPDAAPPDAAPPDAAPPDAAAPIGGFHPAEVALITSLAGPVPAPPDPTNRFADDPAAARLGQALFYSSGLSPLRRDCAFCHPPERAFSGELSYDGNGGLRFRHAPSLLNAAFQPWFFWDGHADTLWGQVQGPLEDPEEMAATRLSALRFVLEDAELHAAWTALFGPLPPLGNSARFPPSARPGPGPLGEAWQSMAVEDQAAVNQAYAFFAKSLAAYVRLLTSFDSPFDQFAAALAARDEAGLAVLGPDAQRGLRLFIEVGCINCHSGPTFSDGDFHNVGLAPVAGRPEDTGRFEGIERVLADTFNAAGPHSDDPQGPQAQRLAGLVADDTLRGRFKTPTLRNVAQTGPWMHDGRFRTLLEAVRYKTTLPGDPGDRDPLLQRAELEEAQLLDLVAFLESLTGLPTPPALVGRPALP